MKRPAPAYTPIAALDLTGAPTGIVLDPNKPPTEADLKYFADWETPFTAYGALSVKPGIELVEVEESIRLFFNGDVSGGDDRALVTRLDQIRNARAFCTVQPLSTDHKPHVDRNDCREALVGPVFRLQHSRAYYQFGIEGKRRAVLYRRRDDEWFELAAREADIPNGYLALQVDLDGDAITCTCPELDLRFTVTDTTFQRGKIGIRSLGQSKIARLTVEQTTAERASDDRHRAGLLAAEQKRGSDIPDPRLVRTFDLAALGGRPQFVGLIEPDRYDLLVETDSDLRALTSDGELIWKTSEKIHDVQASSVHGENGRLLYGFAGQRQIKRSPGVTGDTQTNVVADEMVILRGDTGQILARAPVPQLEGNLRRTDYSMNTGNLTGSGGFDILLREWRDDRGGGGTKLWAYDPDLNLLWHHDQPTSWYGHHWAVQFCDVDRCGRDELLAGGTLYSADGDILWVHDRDEELLATNGGQHYDAVYIGDLADDPAIDPVAFLVGGSGGVYVVDALTGQTRIHHRVGHAQGRTVCRLRNDLPGQQILVPCRWGNMGILTLFSGRGDRLWTIQPDYAGQGSTPISWLPDQPQLLWTNTSEAVQAFYEGHGRRLKQLPVLSALWQGRPRAQVGNFTVHIGTDPQEYIAVAIENQMHIFGPDIG
ncbi:MAG: hypothetical protein HOC74_21040 [Gemmatimonadetes bacterium]|jgi:outer membrane protein assembly factor BamB|nr:hypothetical protein [Gemmatimonadota bacterium]